MPAIEQSNTGDRFGDRLSSRAIGALEPGTNPEVEVGRFLTEASPYPHIAAVWPACSSTSSPAAPRGLVLLQALRREPGRRVGLYARRYLAAHRRPHRFTIRSRRRKPPTDRARELYFDPWPHARAAHRRAARAARERPPAMPRSIRSPSCAGEIAAWRATVAADLDDASSMLAQRCAPGRAGRRGPARCCAARQAIEARIRADIAPCAATGGARASTATTTSARCCVDRRRFHDHRLRGRAGAAAGGAPAQALAAARRGRHAALVRATRCRRRTARLAADHAERTSALRESRRRVGAGCAARRSSPAIARPRRMGSVPAGAGRLDQLLELFVLEKALYETALRARQPARLGRHPARAA